MNLCKRFADVSSSRSVTIRSFEMEKPYSVIGTERVPTKQGIPILLTIRTPSRDVVCVFLPRGFTLIFSEVQLDMINEGMIKIRRF
jgi:hypothetical protein